MEGENMEHGGTLRESPAADERSGGALTSDQERLRRVGKRLGEIEISSSRDSHV